MSYMRAKIIVFLVIAVQIMFVVLFFQSRAWYWLAAVILIWLAMTAWSIRTRL